MTATIPTATKATQPKSSFPLKHLHIQLQSFHSPLWPSLAWTGLCLLLSVAIHRRAFANDSLVYEVRPSKGYQSKPLLLPLPGSVMISVAPFPTVQNSLLGEFSIAFFNAPAEIFLTVWWAPGL